MRILFICHRFPYPPNRGGKIRPFNMVRHLSQRHRVTVASLAHTDEELHAGADLAQYAEQVLAEVVPSPKRWITAGLHLPTRIPSSAAYFWSSRLQGRILEAARKEPFDAVAVHCSFVGRYALPVRAPFRLLDVGDIDSEKWFEYSRVRSFPLSLGYGLEGRKLRRHEIELTRQFNQCTFTAAIELDEYSTWGVATPGALITNGVDSGYFGMLPQPAPESRVLAFLGRMDYYPNVEGIISFAREVFPLVRSRVPDAVLRIIGSNPVPSVQQLAQTPGIEVTGMVKDVRPSLADAVLSVAPIRIARGTQNKILEAMSMGIPVVSSPEAARGVGPKEGEGILVGRTPADFAEKVVRILQDRQYRAELSSLANERIIATHSWSRSMQRFEDLIVAGSEAGAGK